MDDPQNMAKQAGVTRGKLVLIAILAVVLVGVLYVQYGPAGTPAESLTENSSSARRRPPRPRINAQQTTESTEQSAPTTGEVAEQRALPMDHERWQSPPLAAIVQYDPFALPATFPHPSRPAVGGNGTAVGATAEDRRASASRLADEVEQLQRNLESLRQRGVHVIVRQRDQYVALIGDRTIHVGDEIEGFTVTAIDPGGVRVEKKVTQ